MMLAVKALEGWVKAKWFCRLEDIVEQKRSGVFVHGDNSLVRQAVLSIRSFRSGE